MTRSVGLETSSINVLNEMQSRITSVNKGNNGNWVSVFIRLRPKGEKADACQYGSP
jgi:hypothetical protein